MALRCGLGAVPEDRITALGLFRDRGQWLTDQLEPAEDPDLDAEAPVGDSVFLLACRAGGRLEVIFLGCMLDLFVGLHGDRPDRTVAK